MKNLKRLFLVPLAISSAILFIYGISHALSVFNTDQAPIGYVGMPAVTSNNVDPGPVTMFSIDYSSLDWTGNVHAYAVSNTGAITGVDTWSETDGTTTAYGAAAKIGAQNWDTDRKIVTFNGITKIPFRWDSLSDAQRTDLNTENALKYIRGDRSNEAPSGDRLRARRVVLGDIIHSTPLYWEDPAFSSSGAAITTDGNCTEAAVPPATGTVAARCKTLFVGANDGMLHALDAQTGRERFAFIPSQLMSKLGSIADNDYAHQYFVDGQMAIRTFGTQSVLVGALGGGSEGLYGLDVTNPNPATETAAAANNVLWEISNDTAGYADLGYVYGKPIMAKAQDGTPMVVVGNGYNSNSGTSGNNGFTGEAKLYKINALTGAKIAEITTGSGSTASPNGLSTPTLIDDDLDGKADYAYAGDIDGHLWKFDLKTNTATLLLTTDANQAITMAPPVMKHPKGGYMVVFVTGKLFTAEDQKDTSTHYAYGVWDDALVPAAQKSSKTVTVNQTLTEYTYTSGTISVRVRTATNNKPDWTTAKGWKTALPIGGERLIGGDGALISVSQGVFRFLSSNPTISPSATVPGENWWMELNPLTGGATGVNRFDLNADQSVNDGDALSITSGTGSTAVTTLVPAVGRHMGGGVRSQLIALFTSSYAVYHANYDRNGAAPSPATKGVAGGHFDVEFYKAPATVCSGEGALNAGTKGAGSVTFSYGSTKVASNVTIKVGNETVWSGSTYVWPYGGRSPQNLVLFLNGKGSTNYTLSTGPDPSTIYIQANSTGVASNGAVTVSLTSNGSVPGYTAVNVTGGTDSSQTVSDADTKCDRTNHVHEYDDVYDKTGINMLNPSVSSYRLSNAVSATQQFKVLLMNQYLNPAAMLHIGNSSYDPASAVGYVYVKDYQTSAALDVTSLPTYTLGTIGSLVLNMPVDAFGPRAWWGNGDVRNGLLPSSPQCIYYGAVSATGGLSASVLADMYSPVVPPAGTSNGSGTPATVATAASGARHGGALTVQIIRADTPQSAIEQNVSGRPEFGYRVRRADHFTYVLAEYTMFWHHPRRVCFGDATTAWYNGTSGGNGFSTAASGAWNTASNMVGTGWTKDAPEDTSEAAASKTPVVGSTDPKLGSFGSIAGVIGGGTGTGTGTGSDSGSSSGLANNVVTGGGVGSSTSSTGGAGSVPGMGTSAGFGSGEEGSNIKLRRLTWREIFK